MEKKILKWITGCLGFLTVVMCASLYFMQDVKSSIVSAAELDFHWFQQETALEIGNTVVLDEDKLNIELPDGVEEQGVEIENNYIEHTLYVRFDKSVKDYAQNYIIQGNSDHIANLFYYNEDGKGVIEIKLDKACEYDYSYKEGFLLLELIDLHDVYEKIIVIDAGHGGTMPGAVKKDVCEKDLNLDIVLQVKALLDEVDESKLKVFYTRLEDVNPSLEERADMANQLDADLFISVHNNASGDGKFSSLNGTMVLYSPTGTQESKQLAQICLDNVTGITGSTDLGLREADNIYIVRTSKVPVALIEVGYMTNSEELEKLCTENYQKKVAQGIYNAIMQAFEEGL